MDKQFPAYVKNGKTVYFPPIQSLSDWAEQHEADKNKPKMESIADIIPTTKKLQDFYQLLKEVADNLNQSDELAPEDDYFVMEMARIVEFCGGEFPITICTLCGNTDDWHYNNNAECS